MPAPSATQDAADPSTGPRWSSSVGGDDGYRAAFEHSADGVLLTIPDGTVLAANPAACSILQLSEEEICRRGRQGVTPDPPGPWLPLVEERARTGRVRGVVPMIRGDGSRFEAEVTSTIFPGPDGSPRGCVIFRDVTEQIRQRDQLRASNEIMSALFAGHETAEVLTLIARHARLLVDGTDAMIMTRGLLRDVLVVSAVDGPRMTTLLGRKYGPVGLAAGTLAARRSRLVRDLRSEGGHEDGRGLGLGPAMIVPIVSGHEAFGDIVVGTLPGRPHFGLDDVRVVEGLADAAGVALELRAAQVDAQRMAVLTEKARIAADLHDHVIQELFGVGLKLHALADESGPPMADRIVEATALLDATVSRVRSTIFDLQWNEAGVSLGQEIHRMVAEVGDTLGFEPHVTVGETTSIGSDVANALLAVLREALSNVLRHAQASDVEVRLVLDGPELVLTVSDDGVGPPQGPTSGLGLGNMARRAEALGGKFGIGERRPQGTRIEWRVPAR